MEKFIARNVDRCELYLSKYIHLNFVYIDKNLDRNQVPFQSFLVNTPYTYILYAKA